MKVSCLLSAGKFFWYLLFTLLTLLYYTFYGLLAVVLSPNLQVSSVASTLFYAIWNLFSGFLITLPQMPVRFFEPACLHCLAFSFLALYKRLMCLHFYCGCYCEQCSWLTVAGLIRRRYP